MKPIVSPNVRIRYPEYFTVGDDSIVDDFCYFSTKVRIGRCTHIVSGCTIGGGPEMLFQIGDFSGLGSGSRVWCTSDDLTNDLVALAPSDTELVKQYVIRGDVILDDYTAVGSNSVIMPRNHIPTGTAICAMSFVPAGFNFRPWSVYGGIPIRFIRPRNQDSVLEQVRRFEAALESRTHRASMTIQTAAAGTGR